MIITLNWARTGNKLNTCKKEEVFSPDNLTVSFPLQFFSLMPSCYNNLNLKGGTKT